MPEGPPEVNYSSVEAQADSQTESQAETPAGEEQAYPIAGRQLVHERGPGGSATPRPQSSIHGCAATRRPRFRASSDPRPRPSFPAPSRAGSRAKGYAAEASACQIDLASVSRTSALIGFSMKCATSSGEVSLDCEWNDAAEQFGFALA